MLGLSCGVDVTWARADGSRRSARDAQEGGREQQALEKELAALAKAQKAQAKWERENTVAASCGCFAMPCVTGEEDDEGRAAAAGRRRGRQSTTPAAEVDHGPRLGLVLLLLDARGELRGPRRRARLRLLAGIPWRGPALWLLLYRPRRGLAGCSSYSGQPGTKHFYEVRYARADRP